MFISIIGTSGAIFILLGFALLQFKKVTSTSYSYLIINFIGSALLTIYAILLASYPFVALNTITGLIALKGIVFRDK